MFDFSETAYDRNYIMMIIYTHTKIYLSEKG